MAIFRPLVWAIRLVGRLLRVLLLWVLFIQVVMRIIRRYRHFPAPPFISALLDSPLRRAANPPREQVDRAGIQPGMTVLELGPGPGAFTGEIARRVGPEGRVIAVDISAEMLQKLRTKLDTEAVSNVDLHQADAYNLPLGDHTVDVAVLVSVLPEIPDVQRALAELRRVLKPEGILSLSEWIVDPDYPRRSTETGWAERAGFQPVESRGNFFWYTLNFRPA